MNTNIWPFLPSVGYGPDNSFSRNITNQLNVNIQLFITLFDSSVSDLQEQINKLQEITDAVEDLHRGTTIGSLSGSVIGAAGGITAVVGLALIPFTLGASLIVTGVGVGVGFLGGVTGAASNITSIVHQKINREKIEEITTIFTKKINHLNNVLADIQNDIKSFNAQPPDAKLIGPGLKITRGLIGITELVRLGRVATIGKVAAQVSKTVQISTLFTGVLTGLFLALDIAFIVKDSKEIHEINQKTTARGRNQQQHQIRSDTLKFINAMRETGQLFQEALNELKQTKYLFLTVNR